MLILVGIYLSEEKQQLEKFATFLSCVFFHRKKNKNSQELSLKLNLNFKPSLNN